MSQVLHSKLSVGSIFLEENHIGGFCVFLPKKYNTQLWLGWDDWFT